MDPYTPTPSSASVSAIMTNKAATSHSKTINNNQNEINNDKTGNKNNLFAEPDSHDIDTNSNISSSNNNVMITPMTRKNTISSSVHKDILIDELESDMFSPFHIYYGITGRDESTHVHHVNTNAATNASDIIVEECLRAVGNLIIDCEANKSKMAVSGILELLKPALPTSTDAIQSSKVKLINEIYRYVAK